MNEQIKQQTDYDGVSRWHAAGITGAGIKIWNMENGKADHGQLTQQRILDAAPDATVITASLVSKPGVKDVVLDDGTRYTVEGVIRQHQIKILTRSVGGGFCRPDGPDADYWLDLQRRYNLIILNSAGNTGDDQRAYEDIALRIGACGIYKAGRDKYEVRRDTYSSTGAGVDFVDFRGDISLTSGTSFSTPYTAGKIALLCQRYGDLTQEQAADYLRSHAEDLQDEGRDTYTGWGLPLMGDVDEVFYTGGDGSMIAPYEGRFKVSQTYKGQLHKGLDLVGLDSKEIHSTVSGVVEAARWDSSTDHSYGMGQYVRIRDDVTGYRYYFAHLSQIKVKAGQRVSKGQVIGLEGSTGHSTGSHLHYEVRRVPDNHTFLNISEISGIPNKLGIYEEKGEVEDMTEEQVRKIIREELEAANTPAPEWAAQNGSWDRATKLGIVDGSRPSGTMLRAEGAQMLLKVYDMTLKRLLQ